MSQIRYRVFVSIRNEDKCAQFSNNWSEESDSNFSDEIERVVNWVSDIEFADKQEIIYRSEIKHLSEEFARLVSENENLKEQLQEAKFVTSVYSDRLRKYE